MLYRELCDGRGMKRMWGFGIYLMHLSDYLAGRKHKKKARTCDVCGQQFRMIEDMEVHRRKEHPEAHPREEESPEA
jgi:hypothetical protein